MSNEKIFDWIFNFWFSLLLSMVMSAAMPLISIGRVPFLDFINGTCQGLVVGVIIGTVVPLTKISAAFVGLFPLKAGTFLHLMAAKLPTSTIFVVVMSFAMTLFSTGPVAGWVKAGFCSIPLIFVIAYPTALILNCFVLRLTKFVVGA